MKGPPYIGVVEGFYGQPWSHDARVAYAAHLKHLGLNSYLYCPKSDKYLRKHWREKWPDVQTAQMQELAAVYAQHEVDFGVGLSPFELYKNYDASAKRALAAKVRHLASLGAPTLAILFDDMPGEISDLASRQSEIISDVNTWVPELRLLVCPTYYSFDPVLEQHFGMMPGRYWEDLGKNVGAGIEMFWTGNKVCSEEVSVGDIESINSLLGRKVTLWDNYPVNDGAHRSNYLYCKELDRRDPKIGDLMAGHYCNPMNQAHLSLLALAGLARLYGRDLSRWKPYLADVFSAQVLLQLQEDICAFEDLGLTGIQGYRRGELEHVYTELPGEAAREVAQWLRGEFTFDPACLTD